MSWSTVDCTSSPALLPVLPKLLPIDDISTSRFDVYGVLLLAFEKTRDGGRDLQHLITGNLQNDFLRFFVYKSYKLLTTALKPRHPGLEFLVGQRLCRILFARVARAFSLYKAYVTDAHEAPKKAEVGHMGPTIQTS